MSNTTSQYRRRSNQTVARKVIKKVINDKNDASIIGELTNLTEYIERKNYTPEEIATWLPHFADRTFPEMVMIHKEVYHQLSLHILSSERTFLQTYRIYTAMSCMEPSKRVPVSNPKIKFCARYYLIDPNTNLSDTLKLIGLIDAGITQKK